MKGETEGDVTQQTAVSGVKSISCKRINMRRAFQVGSTCGRLFRIHNSLLKYCHVYPGDERSAADKEFDC